MTSAPTTLARNEVASARVTMPKPRGDAIARPALDAGLEVALARARLVLLCAPAGYGKTTALVQALARPMPGRAHAWVSVSEDDDLPSLLACLLAALDPLDLPWRQSPDELPSLALTEQGSATVVAALHQALEHAGVAHGVIVLDDLHRLADARAYSFLNLLIARLPARWTLAATSRQPRDQQIQERVCARIGQPVQVVQHDHAMTDRGMLQRLCQCCDHGVRAALGEHQRRPFVG